MSKIIGKIVKIDTNTIVVELLIDNIVVNISSVLYVKKDKEYYFEVIEQISANKVLAVSMYSNSGLSSGDLVYLSDHGFQVPVGNDALGRVFDGIGKPIIGNSCNTDNMKSIYQPSPKVIDIDNKQEIFTTGLKVIDFMATPILGGKIGIIGGAGVGKTLVTMELMKNFKNKHDGKSVFIGIGERTREAKELYNEMIDQDLIDLKDLKKSSVALVYGQMCTSPGMRSRAAHTGLTIAESFAKDTNVLIFIDNIYRLAQAYTECSPLMPNEGGYPVDLELKMGSVQERIVNNVNNKGTMTSIQAIFLPGDDNHDPSIKIIQKFLSSYIILDRSIAAKGYFPAVNPLLCTSEAQTKGLCTEKHIFLVNWVKQIIFTANKLKPIIDLYGIENMSDHNKTIIKRSELVQAFFTQPMFSAYKFTNNPGQFVTLEQTIRGIQAIYDGKLDQYSAKDLYMIGSLDHLINHNM